MKNTKIIKQTICEPLIDWNKPQWLMHKDDPLLIMLTTGVYSKSQFCGTVLPCETYPCGEYNDDWDKVEFKPIDSPLVIEISN